MKDDLARFPTPSEAFGQKAKPKSFSPVYGDLGNVPPPPQQRFGGSTVSANQNASPGHSGHSSHSNQHSGYQNGNAQPKSYGAPQNSYGQGPRPPPKQQPAAYGGQAQPYKNSASNTPQQYQQPYQQAYQQPTPPQDYRQNDPYAQGHHQGHQHQKQQRPPQQAQYAQPYGGPPPQQQPQQHSHAHGSRPRHQNQQSPYQTQPQQHQQYQQQRPQAQPQPPAPAPAQAQAQSYGMAPQTHAHGYQQAHRQQPAQAQAPAPMPVQMPGGYQQPQQPQPQPMQPQYKQRPVQPPQPVQQPRHHNVTIPSQPGSDRDRRPSNPAPKPVYADMRPPSAEPRNDLQSLFDDVDRDRNGYLTEKELSSALVNGDYTKFNPDTVRLMIKMFDRNGDGALYFSEFGQLWKYLHEWRNIFDRFDSDASEAITVSEFSTALSAFGYNLSPDCVEFLFDTGSRLTHRGTREMSFDMFVQSCINIKSVTDTFKRYDTDRDGVVTMGFEEFLTETTKLR